MSSSEKQSVISRGKAAARKRNSKNNDAAAVITAFNTWAFKREQPSDIALLTEVVRSRMNVQRPLEFVLYWGKGPRIGLGAPDIECLDYLATFGRRIAEVYPPGASIRLIFTDTHAGLNGHSRAGIASYFQAIGAAACVRGFRWCLLGDLARGQHANISHICPAERPASTIVQLERSAARWYQGIGKPHEGAVAYYDMNMAEKRAVELEFPHAVFITFSGSELRELFPENLPIFYMYSVRKGISVKPWFIEEPERKVGAPAVAD